MLNDFVNNGDGIDWSFWLTVGIVVAPVAVALIAACLWL